MTTTKSIKSDTRIEKVTRTVRLEGIVPIMFDRYPGDNQTKLAWHEKVYLIPGTSTVCLPAVNLVSFMTAHNTNSAPKRLQDSRQFKKTCNSILSFCQITAKDGSWDIPFLNGDTPIEIGQFNETEDPKSGIFLHRSVARLDKGIPNPKERPVLPCPWAIEFKLAIYPNDEIKEATIKNLFIKGGIAIGLGTYRGMYGKYEVTRWE